MTTSDIKRVQSEVMNDLSALRLNLIDIVGDKNDIFHDLEHLQYLLMDEEKGLFAIKLLHSRVNARTVGQSSFVITSVQDFSALLDFKANKIISTTSNEANKTALDISMQLTLLTVVSAVVMTLVLILSFIMKFVFVKRLLALNQRVVARMENKDSYPAISGQDEINHIADSFDIFADMVEAQKRDLKQLSLNDELTGLPNRRAMNEHLAATLAACARNKQSLSVMMIDIDYFKNYNDYYGHPKGDSVLKQVANTLEKTLHRQTDFVARYGGEEFICILSNTDVEGAELLAQNVINNIRNLNIEHVRSGVANHVTLSIGISGNKTIDSNDGQSLTLDADKALYRAKNEGRDRYALSW